MIEDNRALRETLKDWISMYCKVIEADGGITALKILESRMPDLILLDIMLPFPLDGFAILRILKNEPKLFAIPVILMSALNSEEKIKEGLKIGADVFLVKPFILKDLMKKISNLISSQGNTSYNPINADLLNPDSSADVESSFKRKFESIAETLITKSSNTTVLSIASQMSMSISTLERWTMKVYGMTPKKFIMNIKLVKAEILLRQNMGSIKDIAFTVGFNSVSYFCLCFRKKYENSPKSFKPTPKKLLRSL